MHHSAFDALRIHVHSDAFCANCIPHVTHTLTCECMLTCAAFCTPGACMCIHKSMHLHAFMTHLCTLCVHARRLVHARRIRVYSASCKRLQHPFKALALCVLGCRAAHLCCQRRDLGGTDGAVVIALDAVRLAHAMHWKCKMHLYEWECSRMYGFQNDIKCIIMESTWRHVCDVCHMTWNAFEEECRRLVMLNNEEECSIIFECNKRHILKNATQCTKMHLDCQMQP